MITRILVPLDGSELSAAALPHVRAFATLFGAPITLLRVAGEPLPPPPSPETSPAVDADAARPVYYPDGAYGVPLGDGAAPEPREAAAANAYLEGVASELGTSGLAADTLVVGGHPAEAILSAARERSADLIAMSIHGRGGIRRMVLGSVSEKLIGQAPIPLLLVRGSDQPAAEGAAAYRRILVPLDGSALAASVLPLVTSVAQKAGATVVLLRVMPEPDEEAAASASIRILHSMTGAAPDSARGESVDPYATQLEREREGAQSSLDQAAADLRRADVGVDTIVEFGAPAETILRVAAEQNADLIAMGTHGRTGLPRLLMGSVADQIARHSQAPLLLARSVASAE